MRQLISPFHPTALSEIVVPLNLTRQVFISATGNRFILCGYVT
jgi:hypothetical protein